MNEHAQLYEVVIGHGRDIHLVTLGHLDSGILVGGVEPQRQTVKSCRRIEVIAGKGHNMVRTAACAFLHVHFHSHLGTIVIDGEGIAAISAAQWRQFLRVDVLILHGEYGFPPFLHGRGAAVGPAALGILHLQQSCRFSLFRKIIHIDHIPATLGFLTRRFIHIGIPLACQTQALIAHPAISIAHSPGKTCICNILSNLGGRLPQGGGCLVQALLQGGIQILYIQRHLHQGQIIPRQRQDKLPQVLVLFQCIGQPQQHILYIFSRGLKNVAGALDRLAQIWQFNLLVLFHRHIVLSGGSNDHLKVGFEQGCHGVLRQFRQRQLRYLNACVFIDELL